MRIALVSPLYEAVPPPGYGGTERVIAGLADGLVALGHDVTLFAPSGSRTRAALEPMAAQPLRSSMSKQELELVAPHLHLAMLAEVYRRSGEFDIIHAHTDIWTLPFVEAVATPTLLTLHGRLDLDVVRRVLARYPATPLVSISDTQREPLADLDLHWVGTCYNGLDLGEYLAVESGTRDYLAFIGRITAEKRPDWAVEVAAAAGMRLRVAAKIDPLDIDYWHAEIEPLFAAHDVEFIGEIEERDKPRFFADAAATLFPIDWPEPFGLVMIESLAAGTPVIALRNGAVPEVLQHGVSGFVCEGVDDMVSAVSRVETIDPDACRARAREFSALAMAERYLELYERTRCRGRVAPASVPAGRAPSDRWRERSIAPRSSKADAAPQAGALASRSRPTATPVDGGFGSRDAG